MRLVLVGPPGAGKGTQAVLLAQKLAIPHISTGDLFRANISEGTALGQEAKSYMDAGNLVPAELTNRMVEARLDEDDAQHGFLLDGFPRSVEQADALQDMLSQRGTALDAVVELQVDEDTVVERMMARGRADDTEDVIRNRIAVYRAETEPLIGYYRDIIVPIDAVGTVEDIHERIVSALQR